MEKIIYIYEKELTEVNELLQEGWKIASFHPILTHTGFGAYVILKL